ncbi:hypothetical protein [Kitasatospora sp. NPDC001095]
MARHGWKSLASFHGATWEAWIAGLCNEIELSFVTDPYRVEVVLEFDERGTFHSGDSVHTFLPDHAAGQHDLTGTVDGWIRGVLGH